MKKVIIIIIAIIIIALAVILFSGDSGQNADDRQDANNGAVNPTTEINTNNTKAVESEFDKFASLKLVDYEGNTVSLEEFRGRPLVINSWAVWCPFCREELPTFSELQREFGQEIVVIAIDRQEPLEKAKDYTDGLGITNDMLFLLDSADAFYRGIGGFSMPETIFMNGAGEIIVHKRGPMELEEMREHVGKIIGENTSTI